MEEESLTLMCESLGEKIINLCQEQVRMPFEVYLCTFLSLATSLTVKSSKSMEEFYELKSVAESLLDSSFKNGEKQIKERLKCPGSAKQ